MSLNSTGMGNASGSIGQTWSIPGALSTAQSGLGTAGSALSAYNGIRSGTPVGYASAAINSGKLASKLGAFGGNTSLANQGFGGAANALGLYQGIRRGGIQGDATAAINGAQLASKGASMFTGSGGALGAAAGYAAVPLALYNEVNNWQSGATGSDALAGAETGAAIGSVVPVIGTALGAVIGGAGGALSSAFGPGRKDPETFTWGALTDAYNRAGEQGGTAAQKDLSMEVTNPYEALAGMFDLHNGQQDKGDLLYNQYGRMGEQNFTHDLVNQLNQAKSSGEITPDMDASQIYSSVVDPWEQSWGKGQNTDPNSALMKDLTTQMISQYEGGQAADDWRAVGGDQPFKDIYANAPGSWGPSAKVQTPPKATTPVYDRLGVRMAADGGRAKRKSTLEDLRKKNQPRFDDGGDVSLDDYSGPSFTPATDYSSIYDGGTGNVTTDFNNQNFGDIQSQFGQDQATNQQLGDWLTNYEDTHPAASGHSTPGSSPKGGTGGLGGLQGLAKSAAPYAALLPIISGLLNKGSGAGGVGMPAGMSSGPTGPFQAQSSPRTANAIDPNTDWYKYGQHPETSFFSNNSIGPLMGKFAAQPASGGANTQPVTGPRPMLKAQGGALDSVHPDNSAAQASRYVQGPGDGQSDDIEAKLSNGEYVMDAHTVSMLGNGSNEAGAKRLDQLRENLRKAAAKPMAKGKQFMHAKPPEHYLKGKGK